MEAIDPNDECPNTGYFIEYAAHLTDNERWEFESTLADIQDIDYLNVGSMCKRPI